MNQQTVESAIAKVDQDERYRIETLTDLLIKVEAPESLIISYIDECLAANEDIDHRHWFTDEIRKREDYSFPESWNNVPTRKEYEAWRSGDIRSKLEDSGVPCDLLGMTFDKMEPRQGVPGFAQALTYCRNFAIDIAGHLAAGRGITLFGDPGLGKSHVAALISRAVYESRCGYVEFVSARRMFENIKPGDMADANLERLIDVPLLIIDDAGNEYRSEWTLCNFDAIISDRYAAMKSTILTSNYYADEFAKVYAPRVIDRLRERNKEFELKGKSYRQSEGNVVAAEMLKGER